MTAKPNYVKLARASRKKRKAAELKPEAVKVQPEAVKTSGAQPKILEKGVDTAAIGDASQKGSLHTSAGVDTARQGSTRSSK